MLDDINPQNIQDIEGGRRIAVRLLNVVGELQQERKELKAENQRLRDENNRLKGEQGKPEVKGNKKAKNISSEKERKSTKPHKPKPDRTKRKKQSELRIDQEKTVRIDKEELPEDAEFKGYETVVVQDIEIKPEVTRFRREKYYSPGEKRSYIAPLPKGYVGQFGPKLKALVLTQYYSSGMSEPKIIEFVEQMGINLSAGTVSDWISKPSEEWLAEADEILRAGLASTPWQHIDDTGTRVDGVNHHCHILCNPFYTAYATRRHKNRLTVIAVLQNSEQPVYLYNERTQEWLKQLGVPQWTWPHIEKWPQNELLTDEQARQLLLGELSQRLNSQQQARLLEAGALTAYYAQDRYPVIPILVSDDAPQFSNLAHSQMLCWVHEGRHYKKLTPHIAYHRDILQQFQTDFWAYYHKLQAYRANPDPIQAAQLRADFDTLFEQTTDYDALNKRLAATLARKAKLLVVLDHPAVPLHNNPAELGARQRVRKRDVSFGPRTLHGRIAWDTFMTVAETAKKLGIGFYHYVFDHLSQANALPKLPDIIRSLSPPAPADF